MMNNFAMTVSELLPALSHPNRADKLRVMQHLATELVEDEAHSAAGAEQPTWSPHTAYEAADALLSALAADKALSRHAQPPAA